MTYDLSSECRIFINYDEKRRLPDDFEPGQYDVICERGRRALEHPGNQRYRRLVKKFVTKYSAAKTKNEKGRIVTLIIDSIRRSAVQSKGDGGFVRQDSDNVWYEVGNQYAREKCGQTFRDLLFTSYKSSTKAKATTRKTRLQGKNITQRHIDQLVEKPSMESVSFHDDRIGALHSLVTSSVADVVPCRSLIEGNNMMDSKLSNKQGSFSYASTFLSEPQPVRITQEDLKGMELYNQTNIELLYYFKQWFDGSCVQTNTIARAG